jgi:hypothetical protein
MKVKSLIGFVLIFIILIIPITTLAVSNVRDTSFEESLATDLKALGLFKGVSDTNFDLNREPTRIEALVMLIRVLGKESEAINGNWNHPFSDVPSWADKYVGYAYENKLTNGVSQTEFGNSNANSAMYLTFVLRALGYSDTNGLDFTWDDPFAFSKDIGILNDCVNTDTFWRSDVVSISYAALPTLIKGTNESLAQKLIKANVFTQETFNSYYDFSAFQNSIDDSVLTSRQISEKCSPAVFYIDIYAFNGKKAGSGSGFFISSDGLAITNYHVASNSSALIITTKDGKTYSDVRIIDADQKNDLALLKINGSNFPFLEMGNSKVLKQGQEVYAIGSPLGLDNTMSQGIISNTNRILDDVRYVQFSVPIAPGSSGGALINSSGKVIGITTAGYIDSTGDLNLAIPINSAKTLNKTSTTKNILWRDSFYPGFSEIYDFGEFTGVKLLAASQTPLGYILKYDGSDFYSIESVNIKDSDNFAHTMYYYCAALLEKGFEQTEVVGFCGQFETDTEILYIELDLEEDQAIYVMAEHVPQYYNEIPKLPDLGWYIGIDSDAYLVDGATMYEYNWTDYYYYDDLIEIMGWYFALLEDQGFVCKNYDEDTILFEGKGLSVVIIKDDRNIYVDVEPLK